MKTYFIQNGHSGNMLLFWRKGGAGYTSNIDDAEEFTLDDALDTVRHSWGSHGFKIWDAAAVRGSAIRCAHADLVPQGSGHRPDCRPAPADGKASVREHLQRLVLLGLRNAPDWTTAKGLDLPCAGFESAVGHLALHSRGITAKRYYSGVLDALIGGHDDGKARWVAYRNGHAAMESCLRETGVGRK